MSIAEQYCTPRAAGDSRRSSASPCPALLQLLPPAVALNQHILGISKLLLPLIAQAAEVLSSRSASPLDQFEVDLGRLLLRGQPD
jgi:hypothetical protein